MLKRHTFWFRTAIALQFLTMFAHSLSFVFPTVAHNETEQQLLTLMQTYQMDAGMGFHPTMRMITTALSSCFAFLYLLGGLSNMYLLRRKAPASLLKGLLLINVVVFGGAFAVMFFLTFFPPILLTGLTFVSLAAAWLTVPKAET